MSDDISMGALSGTIGQRAARALSAGCDLVLHCNGKLAEMREVAAACAPLAGAALERTERALAQRRDGDHIDLAEARSRFAALLERRLGTVSA